MKKYQQFNVKKDCPKCGRKHEVAANNQQHFLNNVLPKLECERCSK